MKVEMLPRAVYNDDATGDWIDTHRVEELSVFVDVDGVPGGVTPELVVIVEDSPDQDIVAELGRTAAIVGAGVFPLRFAQFGRWVRVRAELSGTNPSFDVAVVGDTSSS